jgi:NAD(P)-dependent dehydrogenase (short-subunit alcohol dehydrogenase family)
VIATARQPDRATDLQALARETGRITVERLDVTDPDSIRALAEKYRGTPIDILVNNAGILGDNNRQKFGSFDYAAFDAVMDTNCKGAIRMVEALVDNVAASSQKKIMNISSFVGSIERTFGGQVFYRASKACLNMSMRTLAMEFRRDPAPGRRDIIMGMINPGVVDTGFGGKLPIPMITAERSAAGVVAMIDEYDAEKSGSFYDYSGAELPW